MKTIYVKTQDLIADRPGTYLSGDATAGATALAVQSVIGFVSLTTSSGQILLVGPLGQEKSEIIKTSSTTGPSGTTITLASALAYDHPQDTPVTILDYDRAEIQWSATASGSKSTIAAYPVPLQADRLETLYTDRSQSSGYYFVRFNETVTNTNSDWSDPIPFAGFEANSVFAIKKRALEGINETVDGAVVTDDFLNEALWEARREYHSSPGKRPFRRVYNAVIGSAETGMYRILAPADLEMPYSAENVYGVRVGTQPNMRYYDKKNWDFDWIGKPHTTLTTAYAVGDQDLYCDNVRDFGDSGAVLVGGTSIGYSARGIAGGTLRISADGAWGSASGTDVWQNVSSGLPDRFTVWADPGGSAYIYFNRPLDTAYVSQNVVADYYRTLLPYDSDADLLDEPEYDLYADYLRARVQQRKDRGSTDITANPSYKLWVFKKNEALSKEYIGTEIRLMPDLGSFGDYTDYGDAA